MLGLFNFFGRSDSLKALDQAFRDFDVHPSLIPEAVKLATVRLMRKASDPGYALRDPDYQKAAELLSFAVLGQNQFVASNSLAAAEAAERRLDDAVDAGEGIDAQLILLAVHANIIHPSLADQLDYETDD